MNRTPKAESDRDRSERIGADRRDRDDRLECLRHAIEAVSNFNYATETSAGAYRAEIADCARLFSDFVISKRLPQRVQPRPAHKRRPRRPSRKGRKK